MPIRACLAIGQKRFCRLWYANNNQILHKGNTMTTGGLLDGLNRISAEIRASMAKAFFASAWADQCEESEQAHIISGREIMDVMPAEIDPAAKHAAETLESDFLRVNRQFASLAGALDWLQSIPAPDGDRARTADMLGALLGDASNGPRRGFVRCFRSTNV